MSFLDEELWQGKVFTGTWQAANGGVRTVVEPATGTDLGIVGLADVADLTASAAAAAEA
jgi:benzaldehyde dehydrogenase (NAD)